MNSHRHDRFDVTKTFESLNSPMAAEVAYLVVQQLAEARSQVDFYGLLRRHRSVLATRKVIQEVKKFISGIEHNEGLPIDKILLPVRMQYVAEIEHALHSMNSKAAHSVDQTELKRELAYLKSVA